MLVAMALFSLLGIALLALLRQSTAFLEKGQQGTEMSDLLEAADRLLAEDLAAVYIRPSVETGIPDARFWCDRVPFDLDGDGSPDTEGTRLCFVRSLRGEMADAETRNAGVRPGASGRRDGVEDEEESRRLELRAPGGKEEVMYLWVPDDKTGEAGSGTLYRGTRTPIGGRDSFLPKEPLREKAGPDAPLGIWTREQARERLRPVMTGVLHFSVGFRSRHTSERLLKPDAEGVIAAETEPPSLKGGGLSPTWDSTRGILPVGSKPGQFFLGRGAASLADPTDDVFPPAVRVTVVADRTGNQARTGELTESISPDDARLRLEDTRFAPGLDPAGRFVKVGSEWIRWSTKDRYSLTADQRGARGTKRASHAAGTVVRAGGTLSREYRIPAHREDWND